MSSWPYNDRPADFTGFSPLGLGLDPQQDRELADLIWARLVVGADDPEDFTDAEAEGWPSLSGEQLREAFEHARQARLRQQARWADAETETNLDRAFGSLEEAGILARQDFTCCLNCGRSEIGDERDTSRFWRGFVFYHQQDTDGLAGTGSVLLAYGAFPPEDFDREAHGRLPAQEQAAVYREDLRRMVTEQVIPRLETHGLRVEWDGDTATRILVHQAQWYTRLEE